MACRHLEKARYSDLQATFAMSSENEKATVAAEPPASAITDPQTITKKKAPAEQDVESLKAGALVEAKIGDGGARQAELMQLTWGNHGRWWIFFGLGLCMLA